MIQPKFMYTFKELEIIFIDIIYKREKTDIIIACVYIHPCMCVACVYRHPCVRVYDSGAKLHIS